MLLIHFPHQKWIITATLKRVHKMDNKKPIHFRGWVGDLPFILAGKTYEQLVEIFNFLNSELIIVFFFLYTSGEAP